MAQILYTPQYKEPIGLTRVLGSNKTRTVACVEITGKDWEMCYENSFNRWSNTKTGEYGDGIINRQEDPRRTERVGLLGETGWASLTGGQVDITYLEKGDVSDITFNGLLTDIKMSDRDYGKNYIMCITERGRYIELKSDLYVFGYVIEESILRKFAKLVYTGWQSQDYVINLPKKKSPVPSCSHYNYEVTVRESLPLYNGGWIFH